MKLFFALFATVAFCDFEILTVSADGFNEISRRVNITFTRNIDDLSTMQLYYLQELFTHKSFDRKLPTVVYVHGFLESGKMDLSTNSIRSAYVSRGDHNVVTVDWSYYSKTFDYLATVTRVKEIADTIGEAIFQFVKQGLDIRKLHLVGHSLGGQMVGMIGRYLKRVSNGNVVVPRIYALDPAGPAFEDYKIFRRNDKVQAISKTDAAYVQIIHTNGGFLGMQHSVGHVDFYPNGGSQHPGCNVDVLSSKILFFANPCNHFRSWHFYQQTVGDPKTFPAVRCGSFKDFKNGMNCDKNDIEYMGFGAKTTNNGKYFLQTNSDMFDLSRGRKGLVYVPTKVVCFPQQEGKPCRTEYV